DRSPADPLRAVAAGPARVGGARHAGRRLSSRGRRPEALALRRAAGRGQHGLADAAARRLGARLVPGGRARRERCARPPHRHPRRGPADDAAGDRPAAGADPLHRAGADGAGPRGGAGRRL
ncbi:MAG: hypothetical protein AVDCRST_MAG48-3137, partial [uncultured Friedmanniella sp.]